MKQDKTSELIIRDLVKRKLVSLENIDAVLPFIQGAYCAGYELGMKVGSEGRPIVQTTLDGRKICVFDNARVAARKIGCDPHTIRRAARGDLKTHKGFKWKYLE